MARIEVNWPSHARFAPKNSCHAKAAALTPGEGAFVPGAVLQAFEAPDPAESGKPLSHH